ncbi:MAG: hypothetical protein AABY07_04695 [Nanoarchaeota archaeon]
MIEDLAETAREELKRADHSIYVSLKYTRTVDIIKNIIKRLISAFDLALMDVCEHLKAKRKLKAIPTLSKLRADFVAKNFPELKEYIEFYNLLKETDKARYDKREEYRKHVTLIAYIGSKKTEVDIKTLEIYYNKVNDFINKVEELMHNK